jgi:hypothetical protein
MLQRTSGVPLEEETLNTVAVVSTGSNECGAVVVVVDGELGRLVARSVKKSQEI